MYYIVATLIGTFAIYQLYANLSARLDFISSAACLAVDFIAVTGLVAAAILEQQKIIERAQILPQKVPSKEGEEAESLPINPKKTAEELAATRDIENKIAEKDAKLQQKQNTMKDAVLEWFNDQIVKFDATTQLALRNCAKEFLQTGNIEIKRLPPRNTSYTQLELIMISSIFILAGKDRVQCADFVLKVFANYFPKPNPEDKPEDIKSRMRKKIRGPKTMSEIIKKRK